jgi:hypothetical protein
MGFGLLSNLKNLGVLASWRLSLSLSRELLAEVEGRDDLAVALEARSLEIVEQAATLRDEAEEASARVMVFHVRLEMLGEVRDALGQERDLDLGRPGVVVVRLELGDDFEFFFGVQGHGSLSSGRRQDGLGGSP